MINLNTQHKKKINLINNKKKQFFKILNSTNSPYNKFFPTNS